MTVDSEHASWPGELAEIAGSENASADGNILAGVGMLLDASGRRADGRGRALQRGPLPRIQSGCSEEMEDAAGDAREVTLDVLTVGLEVSEAAALAAESEEGGESPLEAHVDVGVA